MRRASRLTRFLLAAAAALLLACEGPSSGADEDAGGGDVASRDASSSDVGRADLPRGDDTLGGGHDVPDGPEVSLDAGRDAGDTHVPGGFDPHHRTGFVGAADLLAFAGPAQDPAQVKFVTTGFAAAAPQTFFQDPTFYSLHDEWYWYHLMNGQPVPGMDHHAPVPGLSFPTIAAVTAYCQGLPPACTAIGLGFAGTRLYSADFYSLAMTDPRELGVGSILHLPPDDRRPLAGELWLFQLEYQDRADAATVARFFDLLEAALPADVGPQLRWLARSTPQARLAAELRAGGGPLAERVATYEDIVPAGAAEVYNPGLVAGFVEIVAAGGPVMALAPDRIVVLADIPDELPPVAGIVTAVPQTPLAHLNLLAQSRGTPNAFVAGVLDDPRLSDWQRLHVPVAVWMSAGGVVRWQQLSTAEWQRYVQLRDGLPPSQVAVPPVDLSQAPYTLDPADHGLADVPDLTPLVGGKAAGMTALLDTPGVTPPDTPLAITVRAYADHVARLEPEIAALLADPLFANDARVRLLALEGEEAFLDAWGDTPAWRAWVAALAALPNASPALLATVAAGGLQRRVRDLPVPAGLLATLAAALRAQFADLAPTQGLRFRSSSTAEDIEGFNGAGLYVSSTGFLDPPAGEARDLAHGLTRTWASYWNFAAFEERRLAGIEHLSGRMGILVHARFDDDAELLNGVYTLTLVRPDTVVLEANAQRGATSVTNPERGILPEVARVVVDHGAAPRIERVQRSTLAPDRWLLDDARLLELLAVSRPLAERWLDRMNEEWPAPQQRSTLVLDFEFRHTAAGWPTRAAGAPYPSRFIIKQARPLEAPVRVPETVGRLPIPRDLLAAATRIDQRVCRGAYFTLVTFDVYAGGEGSLFAYDREPFTPFVQWAFDRAIPGLAITAGQRVWLDHTQFTWVGHPFLHHGPWDLSCELRPSATATAGFASFSIYEWGSWDIADADGHWFRPEGNEAPCVRAAVLETPGDYLRGRFAAAAPPPGER
jgi:hypothetical protein